MCTTFCLSIHLLTDTWVVSTWTTVNNAAMNIGVYLFDSLLSLLLCIYPRGELMKHMLILSMFNILRN